MSTGTRPRGALADAPAASRGRVALMCAAGEATEGGRGAREGPPQPPQPLSPPSCADVPSTQDDASTPLGDTVEQIVCHEGLVSLPVVLNIVTPTFCPYCSNHDRYPYTRAGTRLQGGATGRDVRPRGVRRSTTAEKEYT